MIASHSFHGRTASPHRLIVRKGLLPIILIALALVAALIYLHAEAISAEARNVARIQAIRIAAALPRNAGDDALRVSMARTLARSVPTGRASLRKDDGNTLVVDSERRLSTRHTLTVRLNTPSGELETVSDASSLYERRVAAGFMGLWLVAGIVYTLFLCLRSIENETAVTLRAIRVRVEHALHRRQPVTRYSAEGEAEALDGLLAELDDVRHRHELAMTHAMRLRLHDIARNTRFIEQLGDHFRQPLHALSLFVAGMQPGDDVRQRAVQSQMRGNLTRLGELLDGMLDLARFDAGAVEPAPVRLLAADLFVRQRTVTAGDAGRQGVTLRWRGGSTALHGDPALLGELLHRLLVSAIASTPHGRVLVAVRRRGDDIRLEVRDNGMGFEPDQLARLFDGLARLPGHPGLGLGLAVARRIVDTLGGRIGARSIPGRGTLYWVKLPGAGAGLPRGVPPVSRFTTP